MADYPISKEAVVMELINLRDRLGGPFAKEVLDMALARLEGFPQMDAVPVVHARWVETGKVFVHSMYDLFTKCSSCSFGHVRNEYQEPYRYCPNCGARMDGGAEG